MTKEYLLKVIPEFDLITDRQLRENSMAVWLEAMAYRNWTVEELLNIPFTLLADNVKITYLEHVRIVCQMCVECDKVLTNAYGDRKTPVNRDYLVAGALLADVGKLYEYDKKDGPHQLARLRQRRSERSETNLFELHRRLRRRYRIA